MNVALAISAPLRSALSKITPANVAFVKSTDLKTAPVQSASVRIA